MIDRLIAEWSALRDVSPEERRQKMIALVKESHEAEAKATKPILEVLTPQQRTEFEELQGKKSEITWPYDELMPEDAEF